MDVRAYLRVELDPGACRLPRSGPWRSSRPRTRILNISYGGALVLTTTDLQNGWVVSLRIRSEARNKTEDFYGEVVWTDQLFEAGETRCKAGVRFWSVTAQRRRFIDLLLSAPPRTTATHGSPVSPARWTPAAWDRKALNN